MKHWMEEHDYESLEQMRGSMSLRKSPDPVGLRARELHEGAAELESAARSSDRTDDEDRS